MAKVPALLLIDGPNLDQGLEGCGGFPTATALGACLKEVTGSRMGPANVFQAERRCRAGGLHFLWR